MIDFDVLTVVLFSVIYLGICAVLKVKGKKENIYFVFLTIMYVYMLNVVRLTLFPIMEYVPEHNNLLQSINLVPFKNIINKTSVLNIIMTVPLGIGMPFVAKVYSLKKSCIVGFIFSLSIEILQLLEAVYQQFFTLRIIDINDVLCNVAGTIIGYLFLKLFAGLFIKINSDRLRVIGTYVYNVCNKIER